MKTFNDTYTLAGSCWRNTAINPSQEESLRVAFVDLAADGRVIDRPIARLVDIVCDQLIEAVHFGIEVIEAV